MPSTKKNEILIRKTAKFLSENSRRTSGRRCGECGGVSVPYTTDSGSVVPCLKCYADRTREARRA